MTESILKALMRLFAIVAQVHSEDKYSMTRSIVESYLKQLVSHQKINQYLIMYDFYHSSLRERELKTGEKQLSLFSVKAIIICEQINKVLDKKQKIMILMQLLEIINLKENITDEEIDFIKTISLDFKFDEYVFSNCKSFILDSIDDVPRKEDLLIIANKKEIPYDEIKFIPKEHLRGQIIVLYIEATSTFLFRNIYADDNIYYNGRKVQTYRTYMLEKGSTLRSPLIGTIYYGDIVKLFLQGKRTDKFHFIVEKVEFSFKNSENGIRPFSMYEESGQLIGIMGGSGVGKSTLLNLLNGKLKPQKGRVLINGYNVHKECREIEGILGFIPQDDLLIEELTVYQNLYYNARLCFKELPDEKIRKKVHKVLSDLDLFEIRNLTVGNSLNKFISGGQRKRLNIALELIREPHILFIDEPTSGLSSTDSEIVMDLLKEQALKGKLLIVNIHQPSSDIFKQFDKLIVMDKGGRIVFQGNPLDSLVYFKTHNQLLNAEEGECLTCGNVNPEQLLQILEGKKVDDFGNYIHERKIDENEWYQSYIKNLNPVIHNADLRLDLPRTQFKVPSRWTQFKIFSIRNIIAKITDKQYLLINLFEAPLLAILLGFFTKYNIGTNENPNAYIFSENLNLPVYIFMGVIVALFLGLMISAEEIIKDRKILQRESFLNLSRFSYYNSKVIWLLSVSAIQSVLFVVIGNWILKIQGMFFNYWLILFVTSFTANLLGLNISASLKSVVAIYILIPLLLVPQILLGGAMVKFDKLNKGITNQKYVPIVGDIMVSRWSYEALTVHQFMANDYQKYLFDLEYRESDAYYNFTYRIPELITLLDESEENIRINKDRVKTGKNLIVLTRELDLLSIENDWGRQEFIENLKLEKINLSVLKAAREFLLKCRNMYSVKLDEILQEKDQKIRELEDIFGGKKGLVKLKQANYNNDLAEMVMNKRESNKIIVFKDEIIRKAEPVYFVANHSLGRSHFFAPRKKVFHAYIETYWFNVLVILIMALFFYLLLLTDGMKRLFRLTENIYWKNQWGYFMKSLKLLFKPLDKFI